MSSAFVSATDLVCKDAMKMIYLSYTISKMQRIFFHFELAARWNKCLSIIIYYRIFHYPECEKLPVNSIYFYFHHCSCMKSFVITHLYISYLHMFFPIIYTCQLKLITHVYFSYLLYMLIV